MELQSAIIVMAPEEMTQAWEVLKGKDPQGWQECSEVVIKAKEIYVVNVFNGRNLYSSLALIPRFNKGVYGYRSVMSRQLPQSFVQDLFVQATAKFPPVKTIAFHLNEETTRLGINKFFWVDSSETLINSSSDEDKVLGAAEGIALAREYGKL